MERINNHIKTFHRREIGLWAISVLAVCLSFAIFDRTNYLTFLASLVGVTSLIYNAKGHPVGQMLMILFSLLYGVISLQCRYYGEMMTYMGMTMPMAALAMVSWLRNPYNGNRAQVRVNHIGALEGVGALGLGLIVTAVFYKILVYFNTANIVPSTISVTTSFIAVYLTFRRSPLYALAYAANDGVLIVLWTLAALEDPRYVSVVVCFVAFAVNDIYGYFSWRQMAKRQARGE